MATIITVHGAFAAGTEDGDDWRQRGSAFERDIRKSLKRRIVSSTSNPISGTELTANCLGVPLLRVLGPVRPI